MQIDPSENGFVAKIAWSTEKAMPAFGSPIVHRDHAYWVNRVGVVYCFDAKTGEERYAKRIRQMCWATPVGIGDRVYFFGKDGLTTVLGSGPKFHVLAENALWDGASGVETPQAEADHGRSGGTGRPGLSLGVLKILLEPIPLNGPTWPRNRRAVLAAARGVGRRRRAPEA